MCVTYFMFAKQSFKCNIFCTKIVTCNIIKKETRAQVFFCNAMFSLNKFEILCIVSNSAVFTENILPFNT